MPTILGYIDRSTSSYNAPFPSGDAELGRGYDLSLPLFNVTEPHREDVLLQYEPTTDRLGYRWGDWKLVSGGEIGRGGWGHVLCCPFVASSLHHNPPLILALSSIIFAHLSYWRPQEVL